MSDRMFVVRRLLAVLAICPLISAASAVAAQADPFGELQTFGEAELKGTAVPSKALGVDPETNDVYAVVESSPKKFTLMQFVSSDGTYKLNASATFQPQDITGEGDEVQGVAIDPKLHRAYVLTDETRKPLTIDPEKQAAAAIYAFSTQASGKVLPPAISGEPKLVSPATLEPTSNEANVSLIDPGGIAVDPTNDEIVVAANIDPDLHNNEEGEQEEEEFTSVIQRVSSSGTLGARYVAARTEAGNPNCGCLDSPVVSSTGTVYVLGEGSEILEFPTPASNKVPPETVPVTPQVEDKYNFACDGENNCKIGSETELFAERLVQTPEEVAAGSALTISPEGDLWAYGRVKYELGGPTEEYEYGGALEFNSEFGEVGWTGGQSVAAASGKCVIDDLKELPAFAAGKEGTLFALDRSPADNSQGESKAPHIIEFGPDGSGCPHPQAKIEAHADGEPLSEGESVPHGETVTFNTSLLQANALSTEWEFEPGVKQSVSQREQQETKIEHDFAGEGLFTVKEMIETDNLAEPEIKLEWKIDIVSKPTVVTGAAHVEGTTVKLEGTVNPNSTSHKIEECFFEYGPTNKYGSKAACSPSIATGLEPKGVSASVSGLPKHTEFHFRLIAKSAQGTGEGSDKVFLTGPAPKVLTEAASGIGQTTATLRVTVDPEGAEVTTCEIEYGTSTAYGSSVPCPSAPGSGETTVAESVNLTGLSPNTTYHYRVVAASSGGRSEGNDESFSTSPESSGGGGGGGGNNGEAEAQRKAEAEAAQHKAEAEAAQHKAEAEAAQHKAEAEAAAKKKREEEEKSKPKPLTRSQLLANALKTCKRESKKKRAQCEVTARKKYGSKAKGKKKKKK